MIRTAPGVKGLTPSLIPTGADPALESHLLQASLLSASQPLPQSLPAASHPYSTGRNSSYRVNNNPLPPRVQACACDHCTCPVGSRPGSGKNPAQGTSIFSILFLLYFPTKVVSETSKIFSTTQFLYFSLLHSCHHILGLALGSQTWLHTGITWRYSNTTDTWLHPTHYDLIGMGITQLRYSRNMGQVSWLIFPAYEGKCRDINSTVKHRRNSI